MQRRASPRRVCLTTSRLLLLTTLLWFLVFQNSLVFQNMEKDWNVLIEDEQYSYKEYFLKFYHNHQQLLYKISNKLKVFYFNVNPLLHGLLEN